VRPVLSHLKVTPSTIRTGARAARSSTATTRVTFALSESATVKLTFARAQRGHLDGRTCNLAGRGGHHCTRYIAKAAFTVEGRQGANAVTFAAKRSLSKLLAPGSYRLTATPTDGVHALGSSHSTTLTVIAAGEVLSSTDRCDRCRAGGLSMPQRCGSTPTAC
jgi:hypothetical protein